VPWKLWSLHSHVTGDFHEGPMLVVFPPKGYIHNPGISMTSLRHGGVRGFNRISCAIRQELNYGQHSGESQCSCVVKPCNVQCPGQFRPIRRCPSTVDIATVVRCIIAVSLEELNHVEHCTVSRGSLVNGLQSAILQSYIRRHAPVPSPFSFFLIIDPLQTNSSQLNSSTVFRQTQANSTRLFSPFKLTLIQLSRTYLMSTLSVVGTHH
jgi:hypothetical protein